MLWLSVNLVSTIETVASTADSVNDSMSICVALIVSVNVGDLRRIITSEKTQKKVALRAEASPQNFVLKISDSFDVDLG